MYIVVFLARLLTLDYIYAKIEIRVYLAEEATNARKVSPRAVLLN